MKVYINDLKFKTIIGILPFERIKKQNVIIDMSFKYKYSNKKKEFVDYSLVVKDVKKLMKQNKYKLIEEALIDIKSKLNLKYPIKNLKLKISKPNILKDCKVSVKN